MTTYEIEGLRVFEVPGDGPLLGSPQDALDLVGETYGQDVAIVAVPVSRLVADFFVLRTGVAGEFIQKLQNYGLRLAIVGTVPAQALDSKALRDFIGETNRIGHHLFVDDRQALMSALGARHVQL